MLNGMCYIANRPPECGCFPLIGSEILIMFHLSLHLSVPISFGKIIKGGLIYLAPSTGNGIYYVATSANKF